MKTKKYRQYKIETLEMLEEDAIDFIRKNEPPEGYFLAFSGGKDSVVLYDLAKRSGVKFYSFYNNTLIDPPELTEFIRKYYPDVIHIFPVKSFWQGLVTHGIPSHIRRWCCRLLKENSNNDFSKKLKIKLVGIRAEESWKRAKRGQISRFKGITHIKPIFWWSTSDIWDYIYKYQLPYCKLYDEGFARLGCIVCPLRSKNETKLFVERYPKFFELADKFAWIHYETKRKQKMSEENFKKLLFWKNI